jgi:hypothetical protein
MTFPYFPNIPNAPNDPADDQPLMQINATSTSSIIAIDHVGFNAASNGGKHKQVQLPVSAVDFPSAIGQGTAYSKISGIGNDAQLFWRFANPATPPLQITGNLFSAATNGYVPLMNGMLLQWGQVTGIANPSTGAVNFPIAFPTNCFNVQLTLRLTGSISATRDNTLMVIGTPSTSAFGWSFTGSVGGTINFFWTAIGN